MLRGWLWIQVIDGEKVAVESWSPRVSRELEGANEVKTEPNRRKGVRIVVRVGHCRPDQSAPHGHQTPALPPTCFAMRLHRPNAHLKSPSTLLHSIATSYLKRRDIMPLTIIPLPCSMLAQNQFSLWFILLAHPPV